MTDPLSSTGTGEARQRGPAELNDLLKVWWVPLLSGVLNLVAGLIVLVEPHNSLLAIALVLGIYLVLAGIFVVVAGLAAPVNRWLIVGLGVLAIVAGVFVIARPGSAVHGVRIVFGLYLILAAFANFGAAAVVPGDRLAGVVRGAIDLIGGVVFLAAPKLGLAALALFVGVYLLLRGCLEFGLALALREAKHRALP